MARAMKYIGKLMQTFGNITLNAGLLILSFFIRRNEDYIAVGSWCGDLYLDNSRYLAEYIQDHCSKIHICWVGKLSVEKEVKQHLPKAEFLCKDRFRSCLKLLRCKYMFFSQMHTSDICTYNVYRGAVMCYLHHGMPIKKWGQDGLNQNIREFTGIRKLIADLSGRNVKYDYFVTSSPLHDATNCTALAFRGCTADKNVHSGTPRNDMYFNLKADTIRSFKEKYAASLGFSAGKRVITYLPTYRRTDTDVFSFTMLSDDRKKAIDDLLEAYHCVLLEKSHFAEKNKCSTSADSSNIIGCSGNNNVQEMMAFTDILISDYSGAFLDFLILDRPIIHFAYDYEYYRDVDSGLYYDIEDFSAGPVVFDYPELLRALERCLQGVDDDSGKRKYVKEKYMTYEQGHASKSIADTVMRNALPV